jgi:hypothetical protein
MTLGISYLLWDIVAHPVTSLAIAAMNWIWIKVLLKEWDTKYHLLSYSDFFQKGELWKVLPVTVTSPSFPLLFLNIISMWNLRVLETTFGVIFILKNTFVILLINAGISYAIINIAKLFIPVQHHNQLFQIPVNSCSGVILSWMTFQGIKVLFDPVLYSSLEFFLFAGFFILPIGLGTIFLLILYSLFNKEYYFSNLNGVLSGYCLAMGFDQLLNSKFWTVCFLLDIILIAVISLRFSGDNNGRNNQLLRMYYGTDEANRGNQFLECAEILAEAQELPSSLPSEVELTSLQRDVRNPLLNISLPRIPGSEVISSPPQDEYDEEAQPLINTQQASNNTRQQTAPKTGGILNWRSNTASSQEKPRNQKDDEEDDEEAGETTRLTQRSRNVILDR